MTAPASMSPGPEVLTAAREQITPELVLGAVRALADTPAPSGASSVTRGEVVEQWCRDHGVFDGGARLERDVGASGCDLLSYGTGGLDVLAHLDEVSYLLDRRLGPLAWSVRPYCYHLADHPVPARVVRFAADASWRQVVTGRVAGADRGYVFELDEPAELRPGDRVALFSDLRHDADTGLVTGSLDNAAGAAAALVAAAALGAASVPFRCFFTDEEEGPAGQSSQTISRGAARVLRGVRPAPLTVVVDVHGVNDTELAALDEHRVPWGASLAEYSSHGRGSVAPPQLFRRVVELFDRYRDDGLRVRTNVGGYVPRSDDVVAISHSNRVILLGYPGINRHFDRGLPTSNLDDLLQLSRALYVLAVEVARAGAAW